MNTLQINPNTGIIYECVDNRITETILQYSFPPEKLKGWVICNGITSSGFNPPDLSDKFIMGASKNYIKDSNGFNNNCAPSEDKSTCNISLTTANLPNHSHILPMTYTKRTHINACNTGNTGGLNGGGVNGCYYGQGLLYTGNFGTGNLEYGFSGGMISPISKPSLFNLLSSSSSYNNNNDDVIDYNNKLDTNIHETSKNSSAPINILPSHYKMIYIMKVPIS